VGYAPSWNYQPAWIAVAAIPWGETETGVTTFKLQQQIDTGNILLAEKISIGENETAGELHDRMKEAGAALLITTLQKLANGTLVEIEQTNYDPSLLKHAPKIFTETCRINWDDPIDRVHNLVRGLSPFPGAFTSFDQKLLKIYRSEKESVSHDSVPGTYITDKKNFLKFACPDGFLHLLELQPEGKKKMNVHDFLRGYRYG
jgi:methionyl-tRNA formyltransferase